MTGKDYKYRPANGEGTETFTHPGGLSVTFYDRAWAGGYACDAASHVYWNGRHIDYAYAPSTIDKHAARLHQAMVCWACGVDLPDRSSGTGSLLENNLNFIFGERARPARDYERCLVCGTERKDHHYYEGTHHHFCEASSAADFLHG